MMASPRRRPQQSSDSTPICRCRVLYLGSAVPHVTKDGLQGIQEPLRELYPEQGALGAKGIDSWLSVWSNGLLLENVDEHLKRVARFFPIESLHYCAAVRYVLVPGSSSGDKVARFLPLDSPFARSPSINHPPLFACILRRTTGIKVLECHVFICKRETAANALVRCCFHAYADSTYAQRIENGTANAYDGPTTVPNGNTSPGSMVGTSRPQARNGPNAVQAEAEVTLDSIEKVEEWRASQNGLARNGTGPNHDHMSSRNSNGMGSASASMTILDNVSTDGVSIYNGDETHKVWAASSPVNNMQRNGSVQDLVYAEYGGNTLRSIRSSGSVLAQNQRTARPRQMAIPTAVPPPPPIDYSTLQSVSKTKKRKDKKPRSHSASRGEEVVYMTPQGYPMVPMVPQMGLPGPVPRRASSVLNMPVSGPGPHQRPPGQGWMPRPPPPHMGMVPTLRRPPPPPMMMPMPVPMPVAVPKKSGFKFGTFSSRGKKQKQMAMPPGYMMVPPPPGGAGHAPPPMMPPPMAFGMPQHVRAPYAMEEPIYMPTSARPLSPVASYQPNQFPHEAYLLQQQYTATSPMAPNMMPETLDRPEKKGKKKSKSKSSAAAASPTDEDNDSVFNTGIYRKGHLNERAFSYSIRQEHRSRSYSSLNTPFADGGSLRQPDKKERELIQMVHDLDLSGDDIERSEVPVAMYQQKSRQAR